MKSVLTALALGLALSAGIVFAAEVEGVKLADKVQLAGSNVRSTSLPPPRLLRRHPSYDLPGSPTTPSPSVPPLLRQEGSAEDHPR